MKVTVLFFGATADSVGKREVELEIQEGLNTSSALEHIFDAIPALVSKHKRESLHFSINQVYANGNEVVREGDELAIFTAVSGG